MIRRLLDEPLAHFLGIGLLLFVLYGLVSPSDSGGERIVVTRAMIADLEATHQRLWGRPPSAAELQGLIESRITDEILYREGVNMGLDRDDAVVKRRVRQKYELIAEEEGAAAPTEAELQAYLDAHAARFRPAPVVSFTQLLVPAGGSAADVAAQVEALQRSLAAGDTPESLAAPTLLPLRRQDTPLDRIAAEFGTGFADALAGLPEGSWQGPVASGYGIHLVRVDRRTQAPVPTLAEVRAAVLREWENDRRVRAREARLQALRERYDVVVEGRT